MNSRYQKVSQKLCDDKQDGEFVGKRDNFGVETLFAYMETC